jgi:hypothetical protein
VRRRKEIRGRETEEYTQEEERGEKKMEREDSYSLFSRYGINGKFSKCQLRYVNRGSDKLANSKTFKMSAPLR